jgi:uncharacterized membrane protein YqhA
MWTIAPVVVSLALFAVLITYATYKAFADTAPRLRTAAARGMSARLPGARRPKVGAHD